LVRPAAGQARGHSKGKIKNPLHALPWDSAHADQRRAT
jgi:hypothetical protein